MFKGTWLDYTILDNSIESIFYFLLILLIGIVFKRFIANQLAAFFFGFIKNHAKGIETKKLQELLQKPVGIFLIFLTLYFAFHQLHFPQTWEVPTEEKFGIRFILWKLFQTAIVFSITWI